jgi:hypothetical protein
MKSNLQLILTYFRHKGVNVLFMFVFNSLYFFLICTPDITSDAVLIVILRNFSGTRGIHCSIIGSLRSISNTFVKFSMNFSSCTICGTVGPSAIPNPHSEMTNAVICFNSILCLVKSFLKIFFRTSNFNKKRGFIFCWRLPSRNDVYHCKWQALHIIK